MPNNFDDVGMFHERFRLDNVTFNLAGERHVDSELLAFRLKFLLEEVEEFARALSPDGYVPYMIDPDKIDHGQAFDALIDLVYVAMGTAHLLGYPWQAGWDLVQEANMKKARALADGSDSKRGSSFDVVKPPGWTPPNIEGLLRRLGFRIEGDSL
jgi:predicted HAD superfamily Cof-like phosphohydrolase